LLGTRMWILFVVVTLILLLIFPRRILPIVVAAVLFAGGLGGYIYWSELALRKRQDLVVVSVQYAPSACSNEQPLQVQVQNNSELTVVRVQWVFSARRPGYRGELTGAWQKVYATDEALAPGDAYIGCFAAPLKGVHSVQRQSDSIENLELGIRSKELEFAP
jgi:hypothetical protein